VSISSDTPPSAQTPSGIGERWNQASARFWRAFIGLCVASSRRRGAIARAAETVEDLEPRRSAYRQTGERSAGNLSGEPIMRKLLLAAAAILTGFVATAPAAAAEDLCRVMDPTGTPLNARIAPNGRIVRTLNNGLLVAVVDTRDDANGRPWAFIVRTDDGKPLGWVFREFIACF